jgi:hypothetical protein
MSSGGSKEEEASSRLGLPLDLIMEAEGIVGAKDGVYPDNWQTVSIFCDMSTQWRVGANGATGLDYAALPAVMSIRKVKDRADVFDCLRVMERAALAEMRGK